MSKKHHMVFFYLEQTLKKGGEFMPDIKQKQRTPIKNINKKVVYAERIKDHAVKERTYDINDVEIMEYGFY